MRDKIIELIVKANELCAKRFREEAKAVLKQKGCFSSKTDRKENMYEIEADYLISKGVIVLPCKFQQTVYVLPTIENNLKEVTKMKCIGFTLSCDSYVANLINDKNKLYQPAFGMFGKTVFLSEEVAEKRCKPK